ncbi:MAG: hypothetical protein IT269_04785, partial [Saprospiraceae bacterium]|nr:hypothetical protein [Saprospiraceae bacterium]
MNNLTKIVLLVACFVSSHLAAQQELMMYSLPDLWHSSSLNPAFFPEGKKIAIGLPGLGLDLAHSGDITYQDIFSKDGDKTKVDFSNALSKLDQENNFFAEQRIETFSFGLKIKKLYLSLGHANRLSGSIQYPKTLPELIWNGNAQYIGQTLNIAPQATIFNWNEWYAGVAADLGKFRVGLRLKMLNGTASLLTDDAHKSATIYTNPDIYQLSLTSDYGLW